MRDDADSPRRPRYGPRLSCAILAFAAAVSIAACDDPIAQSHVAANVPTAAQFHSLLERDLRAFFQHQHGPSVSVAYDMLRAGPTQSGVAHPKYYVWVRVRDSGGLVDEGAAVAAAMAKTHFEVLAFMSRRDIQANPAGVDERFPKALADDLRKRAGVSP